MVSMHVQRQLRLSARPPRGARSTPCAPSPPAGGSDAWPVPGYYPRRPARTHHAVLPARLPVPTVGRLLVLS